MFPLWEKFSFSGIFVSLLLTIQVGLLPRKRLRAAFNDVPCIPSLSSHPYPTPTPPIPVPPRNLPPGTAAIQLPSWHAAPQGVAPETPSATDATWKSSAHSAHFWHGWLINRRWKTVPTRMLCYGMFDELWSVWILTLHQWRCRFHARLRMVSGWPEGSCDYILVSKGFWVKNRWRKIQKFGLWRITANFQSLPPRASAHASGSTKKQKINLRGTFLVNDSTKSGAGLHASRI